MFELYTLLVILICAMGHSIEFMKPVQPTEQFCCFESFHHHSRFTFELEPMNDTSYEFTSIVSLAYSTPYYHKITQHGREKIKMSRMVPTTNRYTFCIINHGKEETFFKIKLTQGAEVMDFAAGPSKTDHEHVDSGILSMDRLTNEIEQSLIDTETDKAEAETDLENVIQRTFYICALSIAVVIGTNAIFYKSIKDIIMKRKRM